MTGATRVLLVDDNRAFADNVAEILIDAGYLVALAASAAEAQTAGARGFDIALVDMQLPDGTGTGLASSLKSLSPDAAVILLTGYSTIEAATAAVRAGVFAYLSKPCSAEELLLTLQQATRQLQLQADKRELSRRAQVAERLVAVGTMTAGLSHEIRNPLNAAGLQLSVLELRIQKLNAAEQAPLLEPLTLVRDEIRRLDHLLEDFLQLARPRELDGQPVHLHLLVGRVLDLLQREADARAVRLERHLDETAPVMGDDGRLRQVVMNLALNALEVSAKGHITFTTSSRPAGAELTIDDSGSGVPALLRERIFEPFFTTKAQGSGLGLSIVHAIVTQHGGSLVVGDAPGGGARFIVTLPFA